MVVLHQSRLLKDRNPYGAVQTGTVIEFSVRHIPEEGDDAVRVLTLAYAYGINAFKRSFSRMHKVQAAPADEPDRYTVSVAMPSEPCLFFYWFEIDTPGSRYYLTRDRDDFNGGGRLGHKEPRFLPGQPHGPHPWQVTVYDPDYHVPKWLAGQVIYHIFPDRFHRDELFTTQRFQEQARPERIFHEKWKEEVDISGKPDTGYIACDFFGGSLNGIREKLDYLVEMGVSVIYLNPIFEARSNHRYDTADYLKIDPLLGTQADFGDLCSAARSRGIRIILDGVFNHTGADSRYFNKYNRYAEIGAWQEANGAGISPYSSWYSFTRADGQVSYDAWWGFAELPGVNEQDLNYRNFITGPDGVVRHWLRLGASGWRLDVSDELPDFFLRAIRRAVKEEKDDAAVIGEVWEDASNKISYGHYRDFLLGQTHDTVMNYPFQRALIGWLSGHFSAMWLHHQLETLREHYPKPAFYAAYNLISSHDIERALTILAGDPDPGSREEQAHLHLSKEQRTLGEKLMRLAVLFQMIYPGCPVIYYGDEIGMEGYRDPFNRRTFPWDRQDQPLRRHVAALGRLRHNWPVLREGTLHVASVHQDCLVIERKLSKDENPAKQKGPAHVLAALNRSSVTRSLAVAGRTILLQPYGWLLEADNQMVDLDQAST